MSQQYPLSESIKEAKDLNKRLIAALFELQKADPAYRDGCMEQRHNVIIAILEIIFDDVCNKLREWVVEQDDIDKVHLDDKGELDTYHEATYAFKCELENLLHKYRRDDQCQTPDSILATSIIRFLDGLNLTIEMREHFFGRHEHREFGPCNASEDSTP